ncbi:MAG: DsrE family protein [Gammaproteobacteria bacterium]|nr:DsrE family protein [Gammaproteobacteria bacterium]
MTKPLFLLLLSLALLSTPALADNAENSPWGGASLTPTEYKPQKVVYDVHVKTVEAIKSVLDRASHLSTITGADPFEQSIVLVLHGSELNFFAIKNYEKYKELMHRAQSLVESEAIKIKMCKIAAQAQGYAPKDIHGFIEMVPMGDAEIVRLQYEEGHAYMQ